MSDNLLTFVSSIRERNLNSIVIERHNSAQTSLFQGGFETVRAGFGLDLALFMWVEKNSPSLESSVELFLL